MKIDPQLYRPAEVDLLLGDCSKAKSVLKWRTSYSFEELVREMVEADLDSESRRPHVGQAAAMGGGH